MKCINLSWLIFLAALLAGCTASKEEDVRQWMVQERNKTKPKVAPIPAPKQFVPEAYTNTTSVEPFSMQKLAQALRRDGAPTISTAGLVAPELARRKEALEAYPLDTMAFVGSIIKDGKPVALLKVENLLYQVKIGNYIGQNYGRVTNITETQITLREIVQDTVGEWIERVATLELQEKSK